MKQLTQYLLILFCSFPLLLEANTARFDRLLLQTDKTSYVSGENIRFKCTLVQQAAVTNNVLFVDICGEGYHIASRILKPENSHWSGSINLPDTLQTGVYLLRAYVGNTLGEPTVVAMPLAVFNRFGNNEINQQRQNKRGYQPMPLGFSTQQPQSKALKISAAATTVQAGNTISLEVESSLKEATSGISLAVFKTPESTETLNIWSENFEVFQPSNQVKIYPQLIVSGKVSMNDEPVENLTVLLSVPDSIAGINYAFTDSMGEFRFIINQLYGKTDFVVQTMEKQNNYQLQLYSGLLLPPAEIPFFLTSATENSAFVQLALQRAGINLAYALQEEKIQEEKRTAIPFYGISINRIDPGLYVPLNDFKEIALEIMPTVKYTMSRDSAQVRLWDPVTKGFYHNPWILVDGVPIFHAGSLNVLHSEKIKWVEIQPQVRCFGNLLIEGLLSIQTVNGDFTDVEFPANALRKQLDTFYDFSMETPTAKSIFNDVLYWEPVLNMDGERLSVPVETSLEKGNYTAVVQAVDQQGTLHQHFFQFTVETKN
ncbi:MAG: hypothetical protein JXR22_14180 [Prolixibacteraceae bacterium]|nr:hypothetical protein [Prolixibacteraceae bacterium]